MNIPKIISGPFNLNYAKTLKSKVYLPLEMNDKMYNKINQEMPRLEKYSEVLKRDIYFYPKSDNLTLMNMGELTTPLNNELSQSKIAQQMYEHINKVANLEKQNVL